MRSIAENRSAAARSPARSATGHAACASALHSERAWPSDRAAVTLAPPSRSAGLVEEGKGFGRGVARVYLLGLGQGFLGAVQAEQGAGAAPARQRPEQAVVTLA